jgi:hypothetical protein
MALLNNAIAQFRIALLQPVRKVDARDSSTDNDYVVIQVLLLPIHRHKRLDILAMMSTFPNARMNDPFSQRKLNLIQSDKPGKNFETVAYINSAVKRAKFKQEANRSHGLGRDSRYEKARTKPENGQHHSKARLSSPYPKILLGRGSAEPLSCESWDPRSEPHGKPRLLIRRIPLKWEEPSKMGGEAPQVWCLHPAPFNGIARGLGVAVRKQDISLDEAVGFLLNLVNNPSSIQGWEVTLG